jgi:hypothetical protein
MATATTKKWLIALMLIIILIGCVIMLSITMSKYTISKSENIPTIKFDLTTSANGAKVAVVMVNVNDPRGPYSVPLWKQYCKLHNCDFIELSDPTTFDRNVLHPSWWKIPLCKSVFDLKKYDYILHVDADTLPLKLDDDVYNYVNDPQAVFWICKESPRVKARKDFGAVNAGVFIMKDDPYTHSMLKEIWANRHNTSVKWPWEQGAIENFISKSLKERPGKIKILEYGTLQSFFLKEDGCDLMNVKECDKTHGDPWIAHVLRGVHSNWEEIYKYYIDVRFSQKN